MAVLNTVVQIVQICLFFVVAYYTVETWRIRRTSQEQVKASQEQIETTQKPCLVLEAQDRIPSSTDLKKGGCAGIQYVPDFHDAVRLTNVGFGPAFNVTYNFVPEGAKSSSERPTGNLVQIAVDELRPIAVAREIIASGKWRLTLNYESFSGRKYETAITLDNGDLKNVVHQSLPKSQ